MRFTVRRPPSGEVSPCCHRPSGGDVACSIDVGVAPSGSAGLALEDRLALAVPRCDMPARGATLRRVRSRNLLDPAQSLVLQTRDKLAPATSADRAVEPAFLGNSVPGCSAVPRAERVIARTSRASTLITSKRRARSVVVFSTQSLRRSRSRAFSLAIARFVFRGGWSPAWRGPVAAAAPSTASTHPGQTGCVQQFAGGQRSRHGNAAVDAHHAAVARTGDRVGDVGERDMPAASPITGDPVGLDTRWHRPRQAKPHPADLGHPHPTEAAVQPLDVMRFHRRPAETLRAHRLCATSGGGACR